MQQIPPNPQPHDLESLPSDLGLAFDAQFNQLGLETVLPMQAVFELKKVFMKAIALAYLWGKRDANKEL